LVTPRPSQNHQIKVKISAKKTGKNRGVTLASHAVALELRAKNGDLVKTIKRKSAEKITKKSQKKSG
jgi:hypothetical protein